MSIGALVPMMLPGPRPLPLLGVYGNVLAFTRDPVAYLTHLYEQYGPIVTLARGTTNYVVVFTPPYNQLVLSQPDLFQALDIGASPVRITPSTSLGRLFAGLTQMNGAHHQQQRRLIVPALRKKRVTANSHVLAALVDQKIGAWSAGGQRDLFQDMREITLAIAVKTLVGLDPERDGAIFGTLLDQWMRRVFSVGALALPWNLPGLPYAHLCRLSAQLEAAIVALIEQKRTSGIDDGDALSMLLRAHDEDGTRLRDDELVGQTATLFVAGHEITARVLSWTLFLLAQHPATMADLLDELDATLHGAAPTTDQLGALPLLEAVIKESMRLLPPIIWWSRISTAPCSLGPYDLPRGAQVAYSPYITHRLPELYPQPARFAPERWLRINPSPYEFLPFSAGPRMCPGAVSAMIQMKMVLSLVLQRYRITLVPGAKIDRGGLMLSGPQQGLPALVVRQDRQFTRSEIRGSIRAMVDMR